MIRKGSIVLLIAVFLSSIGCAQVLLNQRTRIFKKIILANTDTINVNFLSVIPKTRYMSVRQICQIDYGQKRKFFTRRSKVRFENGKKKKFNSDAEITNYFYDHGWNYIDFDGYAMIFKRKEK
jgi:hypothetical protein